MTPGSESDARAADARARALAQRCFDRPLALEAGAGTGKTAALVARLIAWAMGPGWELSLDRLRESRAIGFQLPASAEEIAVRVLHRIAAITFTEAAALEMAERVGLALSEVAAGGVPVGLDAGVLPESPEERRHRAAALSSSLEHLGVHTIHAWCRRLLVRHTLAAGLHPEFRLDSDGSLQRAVVREVVEVAISGTVSGRCRGPLFGLLLAGRSPAEIEQTLTALLDSGATPESLALDPLDPVRVRGFLAEMRERMSALAAVADRLTEATSSPTSRRVLDALESSAKLLAARAPSALGEVALFAEQLSELWQGSPAKRVREWSRGRFNVAESTLLADVADMVAKSRELMPWLESLSQLDPLLLDRGRRALVPLLMRARTELRQRGIVTFAALLESASQLLRERPDVRREERRSLDLLLVDEFQDTDPVQCEIVRRLALDADRDPGPSLFTVGDPKQSIYGWRDADLRAYDAFIEELLAHGGERHALVVNFRSAPPILAEVERCIQPLMRRRSGLQPEFQAPLPCEDRRGQTGFAEEGFAPVEHWVTWPRPGESGSSAAASELEARACAQDLLAVRERGCAWSRVALLLRSMGDVEIYLQALRGAGVPFVVERDRGFYRRREIVEAAATLRCILDPHDTLALLSFVRSAWVGVPDAALIPLWSRDLPRRVSELECCDPVALREISELVREVADEMPEGVPGLDRLVGWELNLISGLESLAIARQSFETDAADVFVEKLRRVLLIEASESLRFLGSHRIANLERFFREIAEDLARCGDPQVLLRKLRNDVATGGDAERAKVRDSSRDAVRVMTIHSAKGLDFDHVYLCQLHKRGRPSPSAAVEADWSESRVEYRIFGAPTLGFARVRERRAEVEAAERVRALYVAMTRARERLVLMGSWPSDQTTTEVSAARSAIDLLSLRVERPGDLSGVMKALAAGEGDFGERGSISIDRSGARWVFPGLLEAAVVDRTEAAIPVEVCSAGSPARVGPERMSRARVAAASRMARSFSARASEAVEVRGEARGFSSGEGGWARPDGDGDDERVAAQAAGTAVHRLLEDFDLDADADLELARQRTYLVERLERLASLDDAGRRGARRRAFEVLERFRVSPLFERFRELAGKVVARELPVWLPPPADCAQGPDCVGYVSGTVDLVYREASSAGPEPSAEQWVVVDFKTDRVSGEADIRALASRYAQQAELYRGAVGQALELDTAARLELWFLDAGRCVALPPRD